MTRRPLTSATRPSALAPLVIGFVVTTGCRDYTCLDTVSCSPTASSFGSSSDSWSSSNSTNPTQTGVPNGTGPVTTPAPTVAVPAPVTNRPPPSPTPSVTEDLGSTGFGPVSEASATTLTEAPESLTQGSQSSGSSPSDTDQPLTDEDPTPSSDSTAVNDSTRDPGDTSPSDQVPDTSHCAAVAEWDADWSQWEQEVLQLVNAVRALGADCDSEGSFGPATPLVMDPMLRCSSRLHSEDMYVRDYFDHTNPDGLDPFERMAEAGFNGAWMGENIAYGQQSPEEVMQAWVDSDGHCSNIMNPHFTLIGVGYYPGGASRQEGQHFWTQNFGTPLD